jgi:hypothetical protein
MPDLTSAQAQSPDTLPKFTVEERLKRYRARVEASKRWRDGEGYDDTWKRLRDFYRLKHFDGFSDNDRIAVAVSFATINVIAPSIAINHPKITVAATVEGDPIPMPDGTIAYDGPSKARIAEATVNYWWRHYNFKDELHLAVRDFLIYGHGWVKVGWRYEEMEVERDEQSMAADLAQLSAQADAYAEQNPDLAGDLPTDDEIFDHIPDTEPLTTEDRPFVERVSPFDIFVDPEATSPRDMRWIAQRVVRDLEEAKRDERYRPVARRALTSDRASKWHVEDSPYYVKGEADRVTIWEFYDIARDEVSVFSNSGDHFLVDPQPMPYPFGVPFVQLRNYDVPDLFYPIGDLEAIEPLQQELNDTRSMMVMARQLDIPKYLYRRHLLSQAAVDALKSKQPYAGIPVDDDSPFDDIIQPLPRNEGLNPQLYQHSEQIEADINLVSGVSEYQRGELPEVRRTATEASIIQDNANARAAEKLDIIEGAFSQVARMVIQLAQTYMTGEQAGRFTTEQGDEVFWTFTADDIDSEFDFEVEAGSTQPKNETFRRQQAMQMMTALAPFFGTGQLNDAAVIMHVLRDGFGVKNPQNFIGPLAGMLPMPAPPEGEEPPSDEEEEAPPNSSGTDSVPPEVLAQLEGQVGYSANTLGVNGGGAMGPGMPEPA